MITVEISVEGPAASHVAVVSSPVGPLTLTGSVGALSGCWFGADGDPGWPGAGLEHGLAPLADAARQLEEYFAGTRHEFDLVLAPRGTEFQRRVWAGLCEIPFGETRTYGQLATRLGSPGASRAVGLANGRNPIAVIVPCHRVIGADGSLTGYAGGMDRKRVLLDLESGVAPLL